MSSTNNKKIWVSEPYIDKEMTDAVVNVLKNDIWVNGKAVKDFEQAFARRTGVSYAVAVSSGTMALTIALRCIRVAGSPVLNPSVSFEATAGSIVHAGGIPYFTDVDSNGNMLLDKLEEKLVNMPPFKAIVPVHLYGLPVALDKLKEIADMHGVPVVEDACQAHGARFKGLPIGSHGLCGCFSFYTTKNMACGQGGMITTDNKKLYEKALLLRQHGGEEFTGYNARMTSMCAVLAHKQLDKLDEFNKRRKQIANLYDSRLHKINEITIPSKSKGRVYHQYVIRVNNFFREGLKNYLDDKNIQTVIHYPYEVNKLKKFNRKYEHFEGAYRHVESCLSLPLHMGLSDDDVERVCDEIENYFNSQNSRKRSSLGAISKGW